MSFVGRTMSNPLVVMLFAGPLVMPGEAPLAPAERWTNVSLSTELAAKDTHRIDAITAGEEQKSSLAQCAEADDAVLCQVLVSVVNVGALLGSAATGW